jgi:hypothetical protein
MRPSRFKTSNDALSRAASVIVRRYREEEEVHDDIRAFGAPSECVADAFRGWDEETDRQVAACGVDPDDLHRLVVQRTTEYVAYCLGL